jgi:hypothetical protein
MLARSLVTHIACDERLTRHLGDAEARVLIEWLVEQAEQLARSAEPGAARARAAALVRRGRAIARFVSLWCIEVDRGAAAQLAGAERFLWPLPTGPLDPWRLMHQIVTWEAEDLAERNAA